jgi:hypothetical protein
MKAKLNKVDNGYVLLVDNIMYATDNDKLSKQNCDEIFEITDVEKLAEEKHPNDGYADTTLMQKAFIQGAKEILKLNKDKLFTLEDMERARDKGKRDGEILWDEFIQSLQQPTEIEVEIGMELNMNGKNAIDRSMYIPKLNSEGCLILKKI